MKKRMMTGAVICLIFFALLFHRPGVVRFVYACQKENFQNAAQQVLEQEDEAGVPCPLGVTEVSYCSYHTPIVEFAFGGWGLGSETSYWGLNYVPSGQLVGYQGRCMECWRAEKEGTLFYEAEGDNTCYVEPLGDGWYYFEASF